MGMYAHVAGWLELDEQALEKALAIIQADIDEVGHYTDSWCVQPRGGGFSRHLFFGCTVRESAVAELKAQVTRIASEAVSQDGEVLDYPAGIFRVVYESEEKLTEVLSVSGGALRAHPS